MKGMNREVALTVIFSLFLVTLVTSPAGACSVCFTEDSYLVRYVYYGTTIGLILLPAGLVTGFVLWLRSEEKRPNNTPSS